MIFPSLNFSGSLEKVSYLWCISNSRRINLNIVAIAFDSVKRGPRIFRKSRKKISRKASKTVVALSAYTKVYFN